MLYQNQGFENLTEYNWTILVLSYICGTEIWFYRYLVMNTKHYFHTSCSYRKGQPEFLGALGKVQVTPAHKNGYRNRGIVLFPLE